MRKGAGSAYDKWKALDTIFPAVYMIFIFKQQVYV
jgi:hypothetical protein